MTKSCICVGLSDEEWQAQQEKTWASGDKQFAKFEKIATLGPLITLVLDACMELAPGKNKKGQARYCILFALICA